MFLLRRVCRANKSTATSNVSTTTTTTTTISTKTTTTVTYNNHKNTNKNSNSKNSIQQQQQQHHQQQHGEMCEHVWTSGAFRGHCLQATRCTPLARRYPRPLGRMDRQPFCKLYINRTALPLPFWFLCACLCSVEKLQTAGSQAWTSKSWIILWNSPCPGVLLRILLLY